MDQKAIEQQFANFTSAFNRHDISALAELWTEQCDHIDLDGSRSTNRSEIKKNNQNLHNTMYKNANLSMRVERVTALTDDTAAVDCTWELKNGLTPEGKKLPLLKGQVLCIVVNERGTYRTRISRPYVPFLEATEALRAVA